MASPNGKQRLELTWIGKENRPRLEPRILLEDASKSHHAARRVSENDLFDNRLIFGDNLLALKALEQEFTGKVKCIFIDPPYNTGSAFEHYDDGVEHSIWLSLMRDRLEVLKRLLHPEGFICCHIDDSEGQYLKVLLDEVFDRNNYVATMYLQVRYAAKTLKQDMAFHKQIEYVHVYRRQFGARPVQKSTLSSLEKFGFYITELSKGRKVQLGSREVEVFDPSSFRIEQREPSLQGLKEIWATGSILDGNSSGRFFRDFLAGRTTEDGLGVLYKVANIGDDGLGYRYFTGPKKASATKGKYFQGVPLAKQTEEATETFSPIENFYDLAADFGNCRHEGGADFRSGKKPEKLLGIVLKHFSKRGDIVPDSFAGSGTTGAVAHKMGRRWIMIELGDHIHSHIIPRMKKVIDGEDPGGITEATGWKGGGGFRYFRLAPSLLELDRFGNHVISRGYNPLMLAEAMCKLMGFTFSPSPELYWQQGRSTLSLEDPTDFLYTTTQTLSRQQLESLSEEVGPNRSLMVCCSAFRAKAADFPNLTLRKIPMAVLARCEWGKDDYSLNVANLPQAPMPPEAQDPLPESAHADRPPASPADARKRRAAAKRTANAGAGSLFETPGSEQEVGG